MGEDAVRGLPRYRGREVDTAGDGFLATFDGPARAVRCAQAIGAAVRDLGLEIRAGVHTGEVETIDGKVGGIAVTENEEGPGGANLGGSTEYLWRTLGRWADARMAKWASPRVVVRGALVPRPMLRTAPRASNARAIAKPRPKPAPLPPAFPPFGVSDPALAAITKQLGALAPARNEATVRRPAVHLLVGAASLLHGGIVALRQYGEAHGCTSPEVERAERIAIEHRA